MPALSTNAIRAFQQKVHGAVSSNQREVRMSLTEARNLSNELSQLSSLMLELTQARIDTVDVEVIPNKF